MTRLARLGQLAACVAIAALAACSSNTSPTGGTSAGGSGSTGGSTSGGSTGGSTAATGSSGGGSASNGGSSGGISATQACTDYANAECNLYNTCSDGYEPTVEFGSLTACVTAYQAVCAARLAVPQTALTSTQIEACAQGLPAESCTNLYDGDNTSPCLPAQGTFATGAACSASAQCASAFCGIAPHEVCGTCQTVPAVGASCVNSQCAPGQVCLTATQVCALPVEDGGACDSDDDCLFGFSCPDADGGLHVCVPAGAAGAPCDIHNRTSACFGRAGLFCEKVGDGGVCTARAFAAASATCGTIQAVDTVCEANGLCVKAQSDAGTGTCEAVAADGEACDTSVGPNCADFSRCVVTNPPGTAGICTADDGACGVGSSSGGSTGGSTGGGTTGGGSSSGGSTGGTTGGTLNTIALIDNDGLVDGTPGDDTDLATWQGYMAGAGITAYDTITVDASGDQSYAAGGIGLVPSAAQLAQYHTIIWFTADNDATGAGNDLPLTSDQESALCVWLSNGGNTLIIFSEFYAQEYYGTSTGGWTQATSGPFFTSYVPLNGAEGDPDVFTAGSGDNAIEGIPFTVTGSATVSAAFGALGWDISGSNYVIDPTIVNPATGTDTLATMVADPEETGANIAGGAAVAAGKKNVGTVPTSTAVYVGIPIEDATAGGTATSSAAQAFFNGIVQTYAGVP